MATPPMSRVVRHLRRVAFLQEGERLKDEQLLESFLVRREDAAFEALVRRHGPMILGVCRRVLQDRHDAEDAFQATFLIFLRKAQDIAKRKSLASWLYEVAHRTALHARKSAARRRAKERQVEAMAQKQVTRDDAIQDMLPLLDQELSRLPDKYRVPIILCDLEGKTRKKAAEQLGLPEETLSTRLARARAMLAKRLARHGTTLSGTAVALAVSQNMASASVPPSLVSSTVKIGALVVAGKTGVAGVISAKVLALTEGVVRMMLLTKLKTMVAVMVLVGMGAFGGGVLVQQAARTFAADEVNQGAIPAKSEKAVGDLPVQEPKLEKPKLRATLMGHNLAVIRVAYSPDGKTLASASHDKTIKLWDVTTGQEKATLKGHADKVYSVAYSPDARTLASASEDKTIIFWDVATGEKKATLKGHTEMVNDVVFSPDGKTLASASKDKTIKVWDVATGEENATLKGHTDRLSSVKYSLDGKTLASGSWDQTIKVWNVGTGQEMATLKGHTGGVTSVAYSPGGKTLASASWDGTVKLWDLATSRGKYTLKGPPQMVARVAYSPDGKTLASASIQETINLWDVATCSEKTILKGHTGSVYSVAYSPDGRTLASASEDKTIKLWEVPATADGPETKTKTRIEKWSGELELQGIDFDNQTIRVIEGKVRGTFKDLPESQMSSLFPDLLSGISVGKGHVLYGWAYDLDLSVEPTTKITIDGKEAQFADLQPDHPVWVKVEREIEVVGWKIISGRAIRIDTIGRKVEGVVHAINATKNTITTIGADDDAKDNIMQTAYTLAKDAGVVINGKKAKFADLRTQMLVSLQISAVRKALVLGITAMGPTVEGIIKSVDSEKNTLSVSIPNTHLTAQSVTVDKDAKVLIDGMLGKLLDLKAGMRVTLQMSAEPDQSLVIGITAGKAAKKE